MIAIDPWAADLARRIAAETGWRASSVYLAATTYGERRFARATIEKALRLFVDGRLPGESFWETAQRIGRIIDAMEEEQRNGLPEDG